MSYRTLNLRGDTQKEQNSLSLRVSARQKNKHHMWEKLTFNFLKKFTDRMNQNRLSGGDRTKIQIIVGEEVSQFLETSNLTDKSLKELESIIERVLISEGFLQRRSPSKLLSPKRQHQEEIQHFPDINTSVTHNKNDQDLVGQQQAILKRNLNGPRTLRGNTVNNTLKDAAKQLLNHSSFNDEQQQVMRRTRTN